MSHTAEVVTEMDLEVDKEEVEGRGRLALDATIVRAKDIWLRHAPVVFLVVVDTGNCHV